MSWQQRECEIGRARESEREQSKMLDWIIYSYYECVFCNEIENKSAFVSLEKMEMA